MEERLVRALDGGRASAVAPGTLTWDDFLVALLARVAPRLRVAPRDVERLALAGAVRDVLPAYDPAFTERAGTVDAFARSLEALHQHCVTDDALALALDHTDEHDEGARARLKTLAAVFRAHRARLDAQDFVAAAGVERALADALGQLTEGPDDLGVANHVRLWHLAHLPPARVAVVVALARWLGRHGGKVEAHVACEPRRTKLPLTLDRALRAFEAEEGSGLELLYGLRDPFGPDASPALASWVVAMATGGRAEAVPLALAEAHGPEEEARWVAALVELWLERGCAPHEIAVVVRRAEDEAVATLGRALDDARIPWSDRRGMKLWTSPLARAVLALPRLVARGAEREEVLRALAVLQGNAPRHGEPAPWRVAGALRTLGVETFFDTELPEKLARGRKRGMSLAVTQAVEDLARDLWALAQDGTADEHCARLLRWLDRAGREGRFLEESRAVMSTAAFDPGSQAILRALARDEVALAEATTLVRALPGVARAAGREGRMSAGEFGEMVLDLARSREVPKLDVTAGAVAILEAPEAVGRSFRAVAVAGLNEGVFPARREEEAFWGDAERVAVGKALHAPVERTGSREEETLLFLAVLAGATEEVAASLARHDVGGRTRGASPFFADLVRASGVGAERVGADPLARSRKVPPRGAERALRAWAQRDEATAPEAWAAPLRSVRARAGVERARQAFFATPDAPGDRYTGRIDHDPALVRALGLQGYASERRPLDVTTLERAARCGFKAFSMEVLKLEERREVFETLDEKQRGHLLHKLLEAGQDALKEFRDLPANERQWAVRAALDEAGAEFSLKEPHIDPALLEADLRAIRRQVEVWLERRMDGEDAWEMVETEVAFGPRKRWPALEIGVEGGETIVLKGRIDGVERVGGVLRVVEFKSGRGEGFRRRLQEGVLDTQFQLVVYAAALQRAIDAGAVPAPREVDGVYVGFRDLTEHGLRDALARPKRGAGGKVDVDVDALVRDGAHGRGALGDAVRAVVEPLRSGVFLPRPRDCEFCQYRSVCRVEAHDGVEEWP